ncbi:MAG: cysteine desulfurase [Planctomycetes bacterium]|nr:cysteine desulfurase [Planctomycetota bacterium]
MKTRWPEGAETYLDVNGSTPVHPAVLAGAEPFLAGQFANPSAPHPAGRAVRAAIDAAREDAARALGAREDELVFTSGGSESNNHALLGVLAATQGRHLVVSAIEHKSVLSTAAWLERRGVTVTRVAPAASGAVDPAAIERALRPDTALVSVMLANNETGVLQPVREIARATRGRGIPLHVDAVAALGKVPIDVRELGCDLLSIAAHKLYAPKGAGLLWIRTGLAVEPLIHGCGQQRGLRGGTENAFAAVAFGRALALLAADRLADAPGEHARQAALRDELWTRIRELVPGAQRNGAGPSLPNTLNVWFPGHAGHSLQAALGARGVAVAAGSAATCASPSHVLTAMGASPQRASESLRFSLGLATTAGSIAAAVEALAEALGAVREARA